VLYSHPPNGSLVLPPISAMLFRSPSSHIGLGLSFS
jgi:hypothetical protein